MEYSQLNKINYDQNKKQQKTQKVFQDIDWVLLQNKNQSEILDDKNKSILNKMIPQTRINKNKTYLSKFSTRSKTFYDNKSYLNPIRNYRQSANITSDFTRSNKTNKNQSYDIDISYYKPKKNLSVEINKIIDNIFFEIQHKEQEQNQINSILNEYTQRQKKQSLDPINLINVETTSKKDQYKPIDENIFDIEKFKGNMNLSLDLYQKEYSNLDQIPTLQQSKVMEQYNQKFNQITPVKETKLPREAFISDYSQQEKQKQKLANYKTKKINVPSSIAMEKQLKSYVKDYRYKPKNQQENVNYNMMNELYSDYIKQQVQSSPNHSFVKNNQYNEALMSKSRLVKFAMKNNLKNIPDLQNLNIQKTILLKDELLPQNRLKPLNQTRIRSIYGEWYIDPDKKFENLKGKQRENEKKLMISRCLNDRHLIYLDQKQI